MDKDTLKNAQMTYITEKYGTHRANASEYDYTNNGESITSRILDPNGNLIAYLTTWAENTTIKHHEY